VEQLSLIFESLIVGLSQMSRITKVKNPLALYHTAIQVFLHGIEKKS